MTSASSSNSFHSFSSCVSSFSYGLDTFADAFHYPPTHNILQSIFSSRESELYFCHINAQSIPSHYCDFINYFENLNLHACLISETWLKPSLPSNLYPLPGFILIRNDRTSRRGGGVAIYLRADLPFKIIAQSPTDRLFIMEYLFIEVSFCGTKILLGVAYSPPGVSYFGDS